MAKKPAAPKGRERIYRGPDGETLTFTESADRAGWNVSIATADAAPTSIFISKGEGKSFARFLNPRRR